MTIDAVDTRIYEQLQEALQDASPTKRRMIDRLIKGDVLWMPHPDNKPQTAAYCTEADILYYGGAAGGGKSDLLLGLAVTDHQKSIIYRREYKQIRELVDRSTEILGGTPARFSQTSGRWKNIPGGRILEFGAVQHEKDKENFKGRPHDFIGFDELPDFTESQFRFLMAWNRSTDSNQRCRVVGAGNPPTKPEGRWVVRFWAPWLRKDHSNRARPGELRFFVVMDGKDVEVPNGNPIRYKGEVLRPKSRTFIPAFLGDNPYFDNTDYRATLQGLPEPLRSQLLYGDFFLEEEPQLRQVIPTDWVRLAQDRWNPNDKRAKQTASAAGVDPARGGKDQMVIARRTGTYFHPLEVFEGSQVPNGPAAATLVGKSLSPEFDGVLFVDVIGIGSSAYDHLQALDYQVIDINFAESSYMYDKTGTMQMRNKRAEAYWGFREALDPEEGDGLALPLDEELVEDLTAPTWERTAKGLLVESKSSIRKRLGRSPGKGDAVVMAYMDDSPGVLFR